MLGRCPRYLQGLLYLMETSAEDKDRFVSTVLNSSFSPTQLIAHKWVNKNNRDELLSVTGPVWRLHFVASRATLRLTTVFTIWRSRMDSFGKCGQCVSVTLDFLVIRSECDDHYSASIRKTVHKISYKGKTN